MHIRLAKIIVSSKQTLCGVILLAIQVQRNMFIQVKARNNLQSILSPLQPKGMVQQLNSLVSEIRFVFIIDLHLLCCSWHLTVMPSTPCELTFVFLVPSMHKEPILHILQDVNVQINLQLKLVLKFLQKIDVHCIEHIVLF